MTSPADWRDAIPAADWELYERAGFGRPSGFGKSPALLQIDIQYRTVGHRPLPVRESMEEDYTTSCGEAGWNAIANLQPVQAAARAAGIPVVHAYVAPKSAIDAGRTGTKIPSLMDVPERGYEFVEEVAPQPEDLLIPKRHPSAFFGTPLASYLIDLGVDTLLIAGCTTSGCARASTVDAFAYNFHTAVLEDCVYDRAWLTHAVNLFDLAGKYADVIPGEEARSYLAGLGATGAEGA